MKLRVINAVKYDHTQMRLVQARWRKVDTLLGKDEADEIVDVEEIVDAIKSGEKVTTIFFIEDHKLNGPLVELAMYGHGNESIIVADTEKYHDKRIRNLPRLTATM